MAEVCHPFLLSQTSTEADYQTQDTRKPGEKYYIVLIKMKNGLYALIDLGAAATALRNHYNISIG